jgi:DNA-binding Lrp family transcriptional regulator
MSENTFDRIDQAILTTLQNNARVSNKELAGTVGLAPSSCLERVRRLHDRGVLKGYGATVNPTALGVGLQAFVAVVLSKHSRALVDGFRDHLSTLPEVINIYHMGGQNDFLVHVAVRDASHLRDLALNAFTTRPEVARIETTLVYEHIPAQMWPNYRTEPEQETPSDTKRAR